jgi:hypothetical protein
MKRLLIIALAAVLTLVALPAAAQDANSPYNSLTISEAYLNQSLQSVASSSAAIDSLYFDLQPGQIIITLSGTDNRGRTYTLGMTLVPSVVSGQVSWTVTTVTLNQLVVDASRVSNLDTGGSTDALSSFFSSQAGNNPVESITITDNDATISWLRQHVSDPVTKIVDQYLYVIYTQDKINQIAWVANPTNPNLSAISVDLQPGRGAIHATVQQANQNAITTTFYLTPTLINGHIQWAAMEAEGGATLSEAARIANAFAAGTWDAFFSAWTSTSNMIQATITEDTATFAWDMTQEWVDPTVIAQADATVTMTEAELNTALRAVVDPTVSSLNADLQPGQVVFSWVSTAENGAALNLTATLVPELSGGMVTWNVTSVTINGVAQEDSSAATGNEIARSWQRAFSRAASQGTVTDLTITNDLMSVTVSYR